MTVWFGYDGERADRITKTMGAQDLAELEELLGRASAVVPMREITGQPNDVIGLRHDVDHDLAAAVRMAKWENARGFRSTYFLLHTTWYWRKPGEEKLSDLLKDAVDQIASLGHEIGFHNNALVEQGRTGRPAAEILAYELGLLRGLGHDVVGTAAHGDKRCYDDGVVAFWNNMIFSEYQAGTFREGAVPRKPVPEWVDQAPLAFFGLEYDPAFLPCDLYFSDSGGHWDPDDRSLFPGSGGRLHMLVHADWWNI